jgi:hypothetical protein
MDETAVCAALNAALTCDGQALRETVVAARDALYDSRESERPDCRKRRATVACRLADDGHDAIAG